MPQTIIAFDFGINRIGIAVGQTATFSAQELSVLKAKDGIPQWEEIQLLISEWKPNTLVVGLPLNMDGSDNEITVRARKFANRLKERFKIGVDLMDERLSTVEAKNELFENGVKLNRNTKPVDSIAARLILESWFETKK